jgi:hypothetical protein
MSRWITSVVQWQGVVSAMNFEQFLGFLETRPRDLELLGVPAVQSQIQAVRSELKGKGLDRLGRWLMGTSKRGRPQRHDPHWVRDWHKMTLKHVRGAIDRLQGTAKQKLKKDKPPSDLWEMILREHKALGIRLERAGLKETFLTSYAEKNACEDLTNRLIAAEIESTPSSVRQLARRLRSRNSARTTGRPVQNDRVPPSRKSRGTLPEPFQLKANKAKNLGHTQ